MQSHKKKGGFSRYSRRLPRWKLPWRVYLDAISRALRVSQAIKLRHDPPSNKVVANHRLTLLTHPHNRYPPPSPRRTNNISYGWSACNNCDCTVVRRKKRGRCFVFPGPLNPDFKFISYRRSTRHCPRICSSGLSAGFSLGIRGRRGWISLSV